MISTEKDLSDSENCAMCEMVDDNPLLQLPIPEYIATKVLRESRELYSSDSNVCASPSCTDGSAWLVKSTGRTRQRPFFVECKKSGQVSCEKNCIMFHSCGVCAHMIAVAEKKGCLEDLVKWLGKRENVSITKMASSGLPKGAGKRHRVTESSLQKPAQGM